MPSSNYGTFFSRTEKLHVAVWEHVSQLQFSDHPRIVLSFKSGHLSLQMAAGTLRLVQDGNIFAAMALVRPQFECLVRGMWLMYIADDAWIEKLSATLTVETAKKGNRAPMLADMLESLGMATEPRLQFIVKQLQEFHELGKIVLNSFTHGGMVPLARVGAEYPEEMILDAVQNSSGVVMLASQLLTVLTGNEKNMAPVYQLFEDFDDCLKFERSKF